MAILCSDPIKHNVVVCLSPGSPTTRNHQYIEGRMVFESVLGLDKEATHAAD